MPSSDVDRYLAALTEPQRSALTHLRNLILSIVPEAEEGLSYGAPAFRIGGHPVAGFSASRAHLTYFPHSGNITSALAADLSDFGTGRGSIKFTVDHPLPTRLVKKLLAARQAELQG